MIILASFRCGIHLPHGSLWLDKKRAVGKVALMAYHRNISQHSLRKLLTSWLCNALQVARRIIGAKGTNMKRLETRETRDISGHGQLYRPARHCEAN